MSTEFPVGIFEGKKAGYNILILKTLFEEGPLSSWEIAKKIHEMRDQSGDPDIAYARTQHIYSVIARKGARLENLEQKGYIMKENSKWELCFPKGLAILGKEPEIISRVHAYYLRKPAIEVRGARKWQKLKTPFGLEVKINPKQLEEAGNSLMKRFNNKEFFLSQAQGLKNLVQEGIDLDRIDTESLCFLVFEKMRPFFSQLRSQVG